MEAQGSLSGGRQARHKVTSPAWNFLIVIARIRIIRCTKGGVDSTWRDLPALYQTFGLGMEMPMRNHVGLTKRQPLHRGASWCDKGHLLAYQARPHSLQVVVLLKVLRGASLCDRGLLRASLARPQSLHVAVLLNSLQLLLFKLIYPKRECLECLIADNVQLSNRFAFQSLIARRLRAACNGRVVLRVS